MRVPCHTLLRVLTASLLTVVFLLTSEHYPVAADGLTSTTLSSVASPTPTPTSKSSISGQVTPTLPDICQAQIALPQCVLGKFTDRAADIAANALDRTVVTPLTALVMAGAETMLEMFLRVWLSFSSFDLDEQGAMTLYGMMLSIGMMIAVLLLMWQAIRTVIQGRGLPILEALQGLVITGLVTLCGVSVTGGVMRISDLLSEWILGDLARNGLVNREISLMITSTGLPAWLTIQLSSLVILVLIIQMIMLWLRNATVPLLALMLPIAAAGSIGTNATRSWLPKTVTAILTVAAYKPIVSLIVVSAVAQWRSSTEMAGLLYALIMFVLSVIAMPALMRVFAPLGVAAAGSSAGSWLSQAAWMAASRLGGGKGDRDGSGAGGDTSDSAIQQERRMEHSTQSSHTAAPHPATAPQSGTDPAAGLAGTSSGLPANRRAGAGTAGTSPGGQASAAGAGPVGASGGGASAGTAGSAGASGAAAAAKTAAGAAGPAGVAAGVVLEAGARLGQAAAGQVAHAGQGEKAEPPAPAHPLNRAEREGGAGSPGVVDRNYG